MTPEQAQHIKNLARNFGKVVVHCALAAQSEASETEFAEANEAVGDALVVLNKAIDALTVQPYQD